MNVEAAVVTGACGRDVNVEAAVETGATGGDGLEAAGSDAWDGGVSTLV